MSDQLHHSGHGPIGFFDGRPDSSFFLVDVDGTIVHVKVDRPTPGVTEGGVRYACRIHERMFEARAASVASARRLVPMNGRAWRASSGLRADIPTIGAWRSIGRFEQAVSCEVCGAPSCAPCRDGESPMTTGSHAARFTSYYQALHGRRKA